MSTNIFLKIVPSGGGKITGNSRIKGHEDDIEIVYWKQGFTFGKLDMTDALQDFKELTEGHQQQAKIRNTDSNMDAVSEKLRKFKFDDLQSLSQDSREYKKKYDEFNKLNEEYMASLLRLKKTFKDEQKELISGLEDFQKELKKYANQVKPTQGSNHNPIELTKYLDDASGPLMQALWDGTKTGSPKPFKECLLTVYRSVETPSTMAASLAVTENEYVVFKLGQAYINSYRINCDTNTLPKETFEITYDKAEFAFHESDLKSPVKKTKKVIAHDWQKGTSEPKG